MSVTEEMAPRDIMEVRDMAEAIARTEQIVAAPRSRPSSSLLRASQPQHRVSDLDIFDGLVARRRTDDTTGPATPAPHAPFVMHAMPPRPDSITRPPTPACASTPIMPAVTRTAPMRVAAAVNQMVLSLPSVEDDAYYAPSGRMRGFADVTLEGYRPEPTLLFRARARRHSYTWLIAAVLLPAVGLAAFAIAGRPDNAATATSTTTIATATLPAAPKPIVPATPAPPPVVVTVNALAAPSKPAKSNEKQVVPVFDVRSLPKAKH